MATDPQSSGHRPLARAQLARYIRERMAGHIHDESGADPLGVAIYSLSDPRDIRHVRYIGQTGSPARRFTQHLNTARLWLPDDVPWWFKAPELRPLYDWIRALHREEYRLPVMVVSAWVPSARDARHAERAHIHECLTLGLPLLNVETEILRGQIPLL